MSQIKQQLTKLQAAIDGRVIRERVLILLTLLALVFLVWNFLQAPMDKQRNLLKSDLQKAATEHKRIETDIASLTLATANSPVVLKQKEITTLKQQIEQVESELAGMSQGLIRADQLPQILEAMLQRIGQLQVVSIQTLPARELQLALPAQDSAASEAGDQDSGVFQHTVVVRIGGSYFELIKLLQALEALSWKFYWQSLDYRVVQYPRAEIELRVYTLSSEEGLLGV